MALINCPECEKQVSDKAVSCPFCAYPLTPVFNKKVVSKQPQVVVAKEGCFLQTLNMGCMLIAGLIALIVLIALFSS